MILKNRLNRWASVVFYEIFDRLSRVIFLGDIYTEGEKSTE